MTLLESLQSALQAATRYHTGVEVAPAAVLWTDPDSQWRPVADHLRDRLPQFLTLGDYAPERRTGPVIWLKCAIARTVDIGLPKDAIPILYLPGVSRQMLRSGADCPILLQPLVELQYRGAMWAQQNGRDWTIEAFLMAEDGLALDLARDEGTRDSLHAALSRLCETPLEQLQGKRLEAEDFNKLMIGDQARDLLEWLSAPAAARNIMDEGIWHAFRSSCRTEYGFDPETEGVLRGAEKLGVQKEDAWKKLWVRFSEAPARYPGLPEQLRKAKPSGAMFGEQAAFWPDENETDETRLRIAFQELEKLDQADAAKAIVRLEQDHGKRRKWVWARLGLSPLAQALEHLAFLAGEVTRPLRGSTVEEMAAFYEESAWKTDLALLDALADVKSSHDRAAVEVAARALYLPWASDMARRFQELVQQSPLPRPMMQPVIAGEEGECLLFVDGLRYDMARRLAGFLEAAGLSIKTERRWSALPAVTGAAKPAVSPLVPDLDSGSTLSDDFSPATMAGSQTLTTPRFRKLLEEAGYKFLDAGEVGMPLGRAWTEAGAIDERGHQLQAELVHHLRDQVESLVARVRELLQAGWKSVRIITDHGWLYLPGGLPKTELPGYLVDSRWSRCAAIRGESRVTTPTTAWSWNRSVEVAVAPDITAFIAGQVYAHGGLSLQECLIPVLTVSTGGDSASIPVRIIEIEWKRQVCRVTVEPARPGLMVDIRLKVNAPGSSLASSPKATDENGRVSLVVPDEDQAGTAVNIVVSDETGSILARRATIIGGE